MLDNNAENNTWRTNTIKHDRTTMCIVHAGFGGFREFVARKKGRCKLIGNRFVIPHDTILATLSAIIKQENSDYK